MAIPEGERHERTLNKLHIQNRRPRHGPGPSPRANRLLNVWNPKMHQWKPCLGQTVSQSEFPKSNGFLIVEANGGLNQQRLSSSSTCASIEDASISGTVVYRGQLDDLNSPRTPKSRLGLQERTFSAAVEDSEINLTEVRKRKDLPFMQGTGSTY